MNPEDRVEQLQRQFQKQLGARTKIETIKKLAGGQKLMVSAKSLARESETHHQAEKRLLETIDRFAKAYMHTSKHRLSGTGFKFPRKMRTVLDEHGIRQRVELGALHESFARDSKIKAVLRAHTRRMNSLVRAAADIKARHGFGTEN